MSNIYYQKLKMIPIVLISLLLITTTLVTGYVTGSICDNLVDLVKGDNHTATADLLEHCIETDQIIVADPRTFRRESLIHIFSYYHNETHQQYKERIWLYTLRSGVFFAVLDFCVTICYGHSMTRHNKIIIVGVCVTTWIFLYSVCL